MIGEARLYFDQDGSREDPANLAVSFMFDKSGEGCDNCDFGRRATHEVMHRAMASMSVGHTVFVTGNCDPTQQNEHGCGTPTFVITKAGHR